MKRFYWKLVDTQTDVTVTYDPDEEELYISANGAAVMTLSIEQWEEFVVNITELLTEEIED